MRTKYQLPRFRNLLDVYEEGAGAKNSWKKTEGLRIGTSIGSTSLPPGWEEGKDICTTSAVICYLGIFLGADEETCAKWKKRTTDRIRDKVTTWREKRMPATRGGRGTALRNSILGSPSMVPSGKPGPSKHRSYDGSLPAKRKLELLRQPHRQIKLLN